MAEALSSRRRGVPLDLQLVARLPLAPAWMGALVTLASLILVFADGMRRSVFDFVGQTYVVRKPR